ncbi:MAG: ATP-dependent DNA helicase RecG [Vicinamibacterales bacterium]|jgi:ATP-dependent DNA helicase RecG|nr:ATP-dependent DNA helicase RecG [Acidobacteriota bacterium]MDP6371833.1 ATP-dependent DNA helicase RecG [Vicinamibacterales bacterium]MDP6608732.1 ATP-dependent DNA helicase RecG [Vicinamibacterales bacterium]|tara:strand:- start:10850 stop:12967 length:2118 start_codon:yes stop_codon:yes gene_type:complete
MTPETYFETPLQYLKGVGPRRAEEFTRAGLTTIDDLLHRFPLRYEDRSRLDSVASLEPGGTASVMGEVLQGGVRATRRRGFAIFELALADATGVVRAVFMNQPFLRDVLTPGARAVLFGPVEPRRGGGLQFTNPQFELLEADGGDPADDDDARIHTGRIVPVYERIGGVSPKMLRRIVHGALQQLPAAVADPLPADLRTEMDLPGMRDAICDVHFPPPDSPVESLNAFRAPAQVRMIFEEFFIFQFGLRLRRRSLDAEHKARVPKVDDRIRQSALRVLPFKLTEGQKQALQEIVADMCRPQPMNRLLQGDVGAGKTIVALLAALVAMENGLQVALMAPTEILAEQHHRNLSQVLSASRFKIVALSGGMAAAARRETLNALKTGAAQFVVGTHALVQNPVEFKALGLAIVDEQHRFGVWQRALLRHKGLCPDVLVMTATPIPRTLALTSYGDLDVSTIRELPPGRSPVRTVAKPEGRRAEVHRLIERELGAGRQAYIVYPLVEESEKLKLKAATEMAAHLEQEVFPDRRVALIHGRLKEEAKDEVMAAFARGEYDLLVSTTVIEVGVDVPNATVMVVEHAERFGLAQLHQLRGRVGRGSEQSHCVLLYDRAVSRAGRARLKAVTESTDGFVLAEKDLELRGPGDFFGTRQSGIPTLRVGDLLRDQSIMERARTEAEQWLESGPAAAALVDLVESTWAQRFKLVGVG